MTFQEAHKNGNLGLVTRRRLTEDELRTRLRFYFFNEDKENSRREEKRIVTDGRKSH